MRRFNLVRDEDVTGLSGTGIVAEGVQFSQGKVVMKWLTERSSVVYWDNIEDAEYIHGHNGKTRIVWLDGEKCNTCDGSKVCFMCHGSGVV